MRPTHLTERVGVSLVSLQVVSELGWLFREQETSDVGIDAQLEVVLGASMSPGTSGKSTGRLLAVQIKSGPSQFAGAADGGWWYPCDAAHVEYWTSHSLPVVVMLVDTGTRSVYWQHVNLTTWCPRASTSRSSSPRPSSSIRPTPTRWPLRPALNRAPTPSPRPPIVCRRKPVFGSSRPTVPGGPTRRRWPCSSPTPIPPTPCAYCSPHPLPG
ncbi:DUF4365 domain-containing protein [Streptomyces flaveolus]|uniref:DUF4365 domain-containing protein n=1 Tax=Streptomyces flaveolus TaxID=67297 RepID=A0ABV3APR1_9ACTN